MRKIAKTFYTDLFWYFDTFTLIQKTVIFQYSLVLIVYFSHFFCFSLWKKFFRRMRRRRKKKQFSFHSILLYSYIQYNKLYYYFYWYKKLKKSSGRFRLFPSFFFFISFLSFSFLFLEREKKRRRKWGEEGEMEDEEVFIPVAAYHWSLAPSLDRPLTPFPSSPSSFPLLSSSFLPQFFLLLTYLQKYRLRKRRNKWRFEKRKEEGEKRKRERKEQVGIEERMYWQEEWTI